MRSRTQAPRVLKPYSPLARAQRHVKQVGRRNVRVMSLALLGVVIVVGLGTLALHFAARG